MSYINNALKKVQREKDGRYVSYRDIIQAPRAKASAGGGWRRPFVRLAPVFFIVLIGVLSWLLYQAVRRPERGPVVAPRIDIGGRPAVLTGPAAGGDRTGAAKAAQLYEQALIAQRGKRWEEAESFYRQALSLDPRHVNALNNLGVLYMSKNRRDEAIELFVKAVAVKEDYVDPYYNLACLYAQLDNVEAGLLYLAKAVKIDGRVREWAKNDSDFNKMHSLPAFKKITEELVK